MADHSDEEEHSFYYQNTSSTFKSVAKKNENGYARCRKEGNVCIQCLGRSKEGCEILSSLLGTRRDARRHTLRANISKVAAQINCTQEP